VVHVSDRAAELMRKVEDDLGSRYPLHSDRSEAYKKASEMFLSGNNHEQANMAKIEWLVFAFRETEKLGSGEYFGPRFTQADGVPFPDFYALPPNTRDYLKARATATHNPIHKARYADFLWDKFGDVEVLQQAVKGYVESMSIHAGRKDSNLAFKAARRACHLARQVTNDNLKVSAKTATVNLILQLVATAELDFVPKVGEALMPLAELLTPEERTKLIERLEQVRASFVSVRAYHLERGTLKVLRRLYELEGNDLAARRAWLSEGESYEAEGDHKLRLDGAGGGPVVAAHYYQLALDHFMEMAEAARIDAVKGKLEYAHSQGPANFEQFVAGLKEGLPRGTTGSKS